MVVANATSTSSVNYNGPVTQQQPLQVHRQSSDVQQASHDFDIPLDSLNIRALPRNASPLMWQQTSDQWESQVYKW